MLSGVFRNSLRGMKYIVIHRTVGGLANHTNPSIVFFLFHWQFIKLIIIFSTWKIIWRRIQNIRIICNYCSRIFAFMRSMIMRKAGLFPSDTITKILKSNFMLRNIENLSIKLVKGKSLLDIPDIKSNYCCWFII